MIKIYDAANGVEAHLVLDRLEHAGIKGRIDGEYLQGGVGELQAFGLVKVMVDAADADQARVIIDEWERLRKPSTETATDSSGVLPLFLVTALLLAIAVAAIYFSAR